MAWGRAGERESVEDDHQHGDDLVRVRVRVRVVGLGLGLWGWG